MVTGMLHHRWEGEVNSHPQELLTLAISVATIDRMIDEFLDDPVMRNAPPNTRRGYRRELRGFLAWLTAPQCVLPGPEAITKAHVLAYLKMLYEHNLKNSTRAKALAVIRSWLNFLGRRGYIEQNVAGLVKRPRVQEGEITIPSAEEIVHMLDLLPTIDLVWPARDMAIIVLLYICLLLPSELVSLNVEDFDSQHCEIVVGGRKKRRVPMGSGAHEVLKRYLAERNALMSMVQLRGLNTSALFISQTLNGMFGKRGDARLLVRQINLVLGDAVEQFPRLAYITPTTLRQAGAVHMLDNGADIRSVAELLGVELRSAERLRRFSTTKKRQEIDRTHPRSGSALGKALPDSFTACGRDLFETDTSAWNGC
jgi:site-specific recombinase XerD